MQEGVGFAVFQKVARTPGETVDQPPLFPSLKRLFDHLEGAPPVVAVHLVGHCEEDAHQLVNRLGKAIVGIVGAAQHALGDSVFLVAPGIASGLVHRSEEHTSELQSLMRISYAVFCLQKKNTIKINNTNSKPT